MTSSVVSPVRYWSVIVLTGALAGLLSGLFGIGGGLIIVPMLTGLLKLEHRVAVGTSLAAIVFPALAGVYGYLQHGEVNWLAGLIIAVASACGTVLGGWIANRVSTVFLKWIFVVFLIIGAIQLILEAPSRHGVLHWNPGVVVGFLILGLVAGTAARLVGIGGGIIMVPAMIVLFGMNDLVAKGTSLLAMIPASITGTTSNYRQAKLDVKAALGVGIVAACTSLAGVALAAALNARAAGWTLAVFIVIMAARMAWQNIRATTNQH